MISECIGHCSNIYRHFTIGFASNDRRSTTADNRITDVIAIITAVCKKYFCIWEVIINQCIKAFEVRYLTATYFRPDRQSMSVGNEVDFGREATF